MIPSGSSKGGNSRKWAPELESFGRCWVENIGRCLTAFDKHRHDRDWKTKRLLTEATYGWAITGHKSQGSQWENVVVWDDGLGRTELDRRRWLYTTITRAEQGLVILA